MENPLIDMLLKRKEYLEKLLHERKAMLKKAPEGKLRIRKENGKYYYYVRKLPEESTGSYIRARQKDFAAALAQKDYDKIIVEEVQKELESIQLLLCNYQKGAPERIYENLDPGRQRLVKPIVPTDEEVIKNFEQLVYTTNSYMESEKKFKSDKGDLVRSKSELIIANTLFNRHIPYKYEMPLLLNGRINPIYPDFTVLNVRRRKILYLEHLGMMDDPSYIKRNYDKIQSYFETDIYLGDQLFITSETSEFPLQISEVNRIVDKYFI